MAEQVPRCRLADLYRAQVRYEEAEPLYQRAIALEEGRHGGVRSGVARALNNLALVYRAASEEGAAPPRHRRQPSPAGPPVSLRRKRR